MSEASLQKKSSVESLVARVADEFLERQKNGEKPDIEEYAARHPDAADLLRKVLAALELIGQSQISGSGFSGTIAEPNGTLGDFRIVREVGRGGMGVVYEAEQISLRRRVALKVLPFAATMDPRHLQRFHNEAQAAACLHHINIVSVHYVGCERGVHFYAMQFIDGQPLSEIIRQLGRLEKKTPTAGEEHTVAYQPSSDGDATSTPPFAAITPLTGEGCRRRDYYRKVAELSIQAAEALDHAHQLGIVHRDIKPANLLLDGRGNVWVTDFGLAHVQHGEASLTGTGQMLGTPRYMSPEQTLAKRAPIDHRTDVYSLGTTLYELLTLRPAFGTEDRQELLRQIAFEEPPRPRRVERAIPAELEIIVLKAMEKRPQDRYATAQELADDLRRWLLDQPIRARRPSWVQVGRKWVRRHQTVVWSAAVCSLLIATVVGASVGWVARDWAARRAATAEVVSAALEEAGSWQQQRRLPEALSAARRAAGLLAGADVDETLQQKVHARLADLELLDRLESIRLEQATAVRAGRYDFEWVDALYRKTFWEAGLDFEGLQPEEAGERIRKTTVAVELATILDDWTPSCKGRRGKKDQSWKHLLRVARAADPDPWRMRIREAIEREDWKALRQFAVLEEVFHQPPATLSVVGANLLVDAHTDPAIEAFLRAAQRQYPNDYWLNHNLYTLYSDIQPPNWDEQIRFAAAEVVLRPDSPAAHNALGNSFLGKGRLSEAIAEYREAIRLKPDEALGHNNLGAALGAQRRHNEAIAEYQEAIRLDPSYAKAHHNLGSLLGILGRREEGIAETREALRLNKDFTEAHYNLANFLGQKGQLDEAIVEYRKTILLKKDYAEAHCNLGRALQRKGLFAESLVSMRRGHELGTKNPQWRYPSARWVHECQRLLELDRKLPAILSGKQQPADVGERLALAELCQLPCKKLYIAALRFFEEAFAADPKLTGDQPSAPRYNAACAAALAGCGHGQDADKLDANERARLRQQALDWLRADLKAYRQVLEKSADKAGQELAQRMQHWLQDGDFAGVRGDEALAKLPAEERSAWRKLWADVAELLAKAQRLVPEENKPNTKEQPRDHTGA